MTSIGYNEIANTGFETLTWMSYVTFGIASIGLVVVFGFYRKQTKPTFVKIIWAFIALGILTGIPQRVYD